MRPIESVHDTILTDAFLLNLLNEYKIELGHCRIIEI